MAYQQVEYRRDTSDIVISVALIFMGFVGLRLFKDEAFWKRTGEDSLQGEKIGFVIPSTHKGVRRRAKESPIWHDLSGEKKEASNGDTVFTDSEGHAQVAF